MHLRCLPGHLGNTYILRMNSCFANTKLSKSNVQHFQNNPALQSILLANSSQNIHLTICIKLRIGTSLKYTITKWNVKSPHPYFLNKTMVSVIVKIDHTKSIDHVLVYNNCSGTFSYESFMRCPDSKIWNNMHTFSHNL